MKIKCLLSFVLLVLLSGCGQSFRQWDPDDYTVKSGDTLYSIAWRYELDPVEMAQWNNLRSDDIIRPGDRLHTKASDSRNKTAVPSRQNNKDVIQVEAGDTLYSLAKENELPTSTLASINGLKKPYVIYPGQQLQLKGSSTQSKPPAIVKSNNSGKVWTAADSNRAVNWQWPVKGKIISKFNKHKNDAKGINIAGELGNSVKAASPGKVVYSGNGLISYGNLIIIKHSQSYLSAYAHNRKLLVKEGEMVKIGQEIAELGKTGTDKPQLHFEIRKNGKPVDPLLYLPSS